MDARLEQLASGAGGAATLVGPAGSGKSTLVAEVTGRARTAGVEVRVVVGSEGVADLPWAGIAEVVARAEAKILARKGVALGGIAFTPDEAKAMIARGYRFVVLGSDAGLIGGAAAGVVKAIRG